MARALSDELRTRFLRASAAGMSARQAAGRFGVGVSTAIRWVARAVEGEPTNGRRVGNALPFRTLARRLLSK